jgi:hypothetical protein
MVLLWVFLFAFRLAMIFQIEPLNAPDEVGHLILVNSMARGRLMTLEEEHQYKPRYSYALFNPAPYVPYATGLRLAAVIDPTVLEMGKPLPLFKARAVYAARLGGLLWFAVFGFFLVLLTRELPMFQRWGMALSIGLLPQLIFTQSYVNLDAMGTAVMLMLVWALKTRRLLWISTSVFLVLLSKLNYYCLVLLPVVLLWHWRRDFPDFLKRVSLAVVLPLTLNIPWLIYSYQVNSGKYGTLLGFSALQKIYDDPPGRLRIFARAFTGNTVNSAFGVFGYFSQPMPTVFFWIWKGLLLPAGFVFLVSALLKSPRQPWHFALLVVAFTNTAMHYAASYQGALSPQGRYLFPACAIFLGYLAHGLSKWPAAERALMGFFILAAVVAVGFC